MDMQLACNKGPCDPELANVFATCFRPNELVDPLISVSICVCVGDVESAGETLLRSAALAVCVKVGQQRPSVIIMMDGSFSTALSAPEFNAVVAGVVLK